MKKAFKDTTVGKILQTVAPTIIDTVGNVFPPANLLKGLIDEDQFISNEDRVKLDMAMKDYELEVFKIEIEDRQSAREMYKAKSEKADDVAKSVMKWNLPLILVLVIINVLVVMYLDKVLIAIVANIIGMVLQSLISERQTLINFFFGSSEGSKKKDEQKLNQK